MKKAKSNYESIFSFFQQDVSNEIITPRMSRFDKFDLNRLIDKKLKEIEEKQSVTFNDQDRLPEFIGYDLYSLFHNHSRELRFSEIDRSNSWQLELYKKINDYYLRAITQNRSFAAAIMASEIVANLTNFIKENPPPGCAGGESAPNILKKFLKKLQNAKDPDQDDPDADPQKDPPPQDSDKGQNPQPKDSDRPQPPDGDGGDGRGHEEPRHVPDVQDYDSSDDPDAPQTNQPGVGSGKGSQDNFLYDYEKVLRGVIDSAAENAQEEIRETEEFIKNFSGDPNSSIDKIDEMQNLKALLENVKFTNQNLNDFIKKSIKLSTNYFSNMYKEYDESIIDAEVIHDIDPLEDLIPKLLKANLYDLTTKERQYQFKIDLYIDISGSMGSHHYFGEEEVKGIVMAKLLYYRMKRLNIFNDVYIFNKNIEKIDKNKESEIIMSLGVRGGTSIGTVINHINKTQNASLVLTDMGDDFSQYSDKAYIIGILDAHFGGVKNDSFFRRKQIVKFNQDGKFKFVRRRAIECF